MATTAQIMDLATQYHATGNSVLAEQYARSIIAAEPNHAGALHLLGLIARQQDKPAEALAFLNRSLTAQGSNGLVWQHAGDLLLALGDVPGGVSYYEQALAAATRFRRGLQHPGHSSDTRRASGAGGRMLPPGHASAPTFAPAYNNLGMLFGGWVDGPRRRRLMRKHRSCGRTVPTSYSTSATPITTWAIGTQRLPVFAVL